MSFRKGNVTVIAVEPEGKCELCGKKAELRPYGPRGERICFECGQKNPKATQRQMERFLFNKNTQ